MDANKRLYVVLQNTETHPANHSNGCSIIPNASSVSKELLPCTVQSSYTNQSSNGNDTEKVQGKRYCLKCFIIALTAVRLCVIGKEVKTPAFFCPHFT